MIPQFPRFSKLSLDQKEMIQSFSKSFSPYSDYNFISLWSYNTNDDIELSLLNNNLVVRFSDYITTQPFYSFLGTNNILETAKGLIAYSIKQKRGAFLKLIPDIVITSCPQLTQKFVIAEDRDNFDYIYTLSDWIKLEGKAYHHKRWRYHQFCRLNPLHKLVTIDLSKSHIKSTIVTIFELWEKGRKKIRKDTENELIALNRLLDSSSQFHLVCIGIYIQDKLIAFSINEVSHNNYAIGHFAKVDPSFKGLSETLHVYSAQKLLEAGCKLFNLEQDLGLEGLRIDKESWHPKQYFKKYTITQSSNSQPDKQLKSK